MSTKLDGIQRRCRQDSARTPETPYALIYDLAAEVAALRAELEELRAARTPSPGKRGRPRGDVDERKNVGY